MVVQAQRTRLSWHVRTRKASWVCLAAYGLLAGGHAAAKSPVYSDHLDLTFVLNDAGQRQPIRTPADWALRRQHVLDAIQTVMGPLPAPAEPTPLDVQVLEETQQDGYVRRKLAYHTDRADQRVTAWLLIPTDQAAGRRPAALCLHQTTTPGKDQPVGLSDRPSLHYALELVRRGYVTLSPDYPSLGEYQYDFDADDYESGSMKAIYDNIRAIDLLVSLPEVDPERIASIGHSLGGHNGLFTALFEPRIKAVVTCCGFTQATHYMKGDLTGWSGPRYMPRVAADYGNSPARIPFDFSEILAALAPRGVFAVAPLHDDNFDVEGVRLAVAAARPVFELHGAGARLVAIHPDDQHDFPADARRQAYAFLDEAQSPE